MFVCVNHFRFTNNFYISCRLNKKINDLYNLIKIRRSESQILSKAVADSECLFFFKVTLVT